MGKTRVIYFVYSPKEFDQLISFVFYQGGKIESGAYVYSGRRYLVLNLIGVEIPKEWKEKVEQIFGMDTVNVTKHADVEKLPKLSKAIIVSNSLEKIKHVIQHFSSI